MEPSCHLSQLLDPELEFTQLVFKQLRQNVDATDYFAALCQWQGECIAEVAAFNTIKQLVGRHPRLLSKPTSDGFWLGLRNRDCFNANCFRNGGFDGPPTCYYGHDLSALQSKCLGGQSFTILRRCLEVIADNPYLRQWESGMPLVILHLLSTNLQSVDNFNAVWWSPRLLPPEVPAQIRNSLLPRYLTRLHVAGHLTEFGGLSLSIARLIAEHSPYVFENVTHLKLFDFHDRRAAVKLSLAVISELNEVTKLLPSVRYLELGNCYGEFADAHELLICQFPASDQCRVLNISNCYDMYVDGYGSLLNLPSSLELVHVNEAMLWHQLKRLELDLTLIDEVPPLLVNDVGNLAEVVVAWGRRVVGLICNEVTVVDDLSWLESGAFPNLRYLESTMCSLVFRQCAFNEKALTCLNVRIVSFQTAHHAAVLRQLCFLLSPEAALRVLIVRGEVYQALIDCIDIPDMPWQRRTSPLHLVVDAVARKPYVTGPKSWRSVLKLCGDAWIAFGVYMGQFNINVHYTAIGYVGDVHFYEELTGVDIGLYDLARARSKETQK